MRKEFSVYLDLVRIVAAVLVFVHHLNIPLITLNRIPFGQLGEFGVVCFFVMSGCVIAFVTDRSEKTWSVYAASRVTRIYSVALPTILLVPMLDFIGRKFFGNYPGSYPFDQFLLRMLISCFFLNEAWNQSVLLFSDSPYWSLCYEVWYYVGFGVLFYVKSKWRNYLLFLIFLIVGPKVLIMAPIWGLGVCMYHLDKEGSWSNGFYAAAAVIGGIGVLVFEFFNLHSYFTNWTQALIPDEAFKHLLHARGFLGDWVLALLVAMHLFGMKKAKIFGTGVLVRMEWGVRYLAKYTFILYLLHQPLIYFWRAAWGLDSSSSYAVTKIFVCVVFSVLVLEIPIEKFRLLLRRLSRQVVSGIGNSKLRDASPLKNGLTH